MKTLPLILRAKHLMQWWLSDKSVNLYYHFSQIRLLVILWQFIHCLSWQCFSRVGCQFPGLYPTLFNMAWDSHTKTYAFTPKANLAYPIHLTFMSLDCGGGGKLSIRGQKTSRRLCTTDFFFQQSFFDNLDKAIEVIYRLYRFSRLYRLNTYGYMFALKQVLGQALK